MGYRGRVVEPVTFETLLRRPHVKQSQIHRTCCSSIREVEVSESVGVSSVSYQQLKPCPAIGRVCNCCRTHNLTGPPTRLLIK